MGSVSQSFQPHTAMRNRYNWTRPAAHIYSYNTDPSTFKTGYSYSSSSSSSGARSARASSVAEGTEAGVSRASRAMTAAPAASDLAGYSGFYGRQLAQHSDSVSTRATRAVSTAVTEQTSKSVEVAERTTKKVDFMKEHSQSLEYGKNSRSQALRRAEIHAVKSGKDPRHVPVPRNLDDDICKKVADIHMYEDSSKTQHSRMKVEKLEKELNALINSSMSYKSVYNKTAKQMAMEAMEACESEAASSKKVRKTVVESSSKRAVVA